MSVIVETSDWRKPIIEYLSEGKLPPDDKEAKNIRVKAPSLVVDNNILYKKGYLTPRLRCVNGKEAKYLIREIHEGMAGADEGELTIVHKISWIAADYVSRHTRSDL